MKKSFFMAHGAPTIYLDDNAYTQSLKQFKQENPTITKIILMSAHFESKHIKVSVSETYETMYDFQGFPKALYQVHMDTKGDPDLGHQVVQCLKEQGLDAGTIYDRPLDHGAWTLLKLIDPENTLKVVLMSIDPFSQPSEQLKIGQALRDLDDHTAFIFSGGLVHNLTWLNFSNQIDPQAQRFWAWLDVTLQTKNTTALLNYEDQIDATMAVPRPEHFAGIFCVYGTMEDKGSVILKQHMFQYGTLSLDYYVFNQD